MSGKLVSRRQQLKSMIEELNTRYYEEGSLPKSEYTRLIEKYGEELELVERELGAES